MNKARFAIVTFVLSILTMSILACASYAQTATPQPSSEPQTEGGWQGHPGWQGRGGPGGWGFFGLNLTDAQMQQIKSLHEQSRASAKPYLDQLKPLRQQMQALIHSGNFDENAARALATQQSELTTELDVINARTEAAIYNLLTPDQKAKLSQRWQKGHGGRGPSPKSSN
jgi:protein CpxP